MKISLLLLALLAVPYVSCSQSSRCQNVYIWDFVDENNQKTPYTKDLTNAVEEALVNIAECNILQRRNFASLHQQLSNEANVQSVRDIKTSTIQSLSTKGAEMVIFGTLNMISRKEYELQLRIENIKSTKIVRMKSADLDINDLVDSKRKKILIDKLVRDLIGSRISESSVASSASKNSYKIKNCLAGYEFELVSCLGDKGKQTVTITLGIKHNLPNQDIDLYVKNSKGYGSGQEFDTEKVTIGNQSNSTYSVTNAIPTGISMKISATFRNILPDTKSLDKAILILKSENKNGGKGRQNCELEIDNIPIQW